MQYSREHFALTLRRTGFPEAAGEALRVLPDPVDDDQIAAFLAPYGITDYRCDGHDVGPAPRCRAHVWLSSLGRPSLPAAQAARTRVACGPFGPWATSNSTCWFSSRLRKP